MDIIELKKNVFFNLASDYIYIILPKLRIYTSQIYIYIC